MLEVKKNNITLLTERTSLVGDVAVNISFKSKVNSCCLNKLRGGWSCEMPDAKDEKHCFPAGSEEACVAYALYSVVNNALCGDPVATSKSKVGSVNCGAHNGHFFICWKVKGTGTAVRKSIGIALKCLIPDKMYAVYQQCIREIGRKPDRDVFNYVADSIGKDIKDDVRIAVVGNIKTTKEVMQSIIDVLVKKLVHQPTKGVKTKPSGHKECNHSHLTEIKTTGWSTFVTRDYIAAKLKGINPQICDKYILLPMQQAKWDVHRGKLKSSIKDYVAARYAKAKDNMSAIMGYIMIANAYCSSYDVSSMLKADIKPADVEKAISSTL
jgi:hypothetical protein